MQKLSIPTGAGVKAIPLKDNEGHILCTVYYDPTDTTLDQRYHKTAKAMRKVIPAIKQLINVGINADGSPASEQYAPALNKAERAIKRAISQLLPMDNPEGLFAVRRPFASVKGSFYCRHVLDALMAAVNMAADKAEM